MSNPPVTLPARVVAVAALLSGIGAAACTEPEVTPAPRHGLVLTEVAAADEPTDWIEVLNVSGRALDLVDYAYVDLRGDLDRARPFADVTLTPGERHLQPINDLRSGFALGPDEEVWIYRASDGALVDGADWDEATPAASSRSRSRRPRRPTRPAADPPRAAPRAVAVRAQPCTMDRCAAG